MHSLLYKEGSRIRLVRAYIISKIACTIPYHKLKTEEKTKVNSLIKRAYKRTSGIPISTSNEDLEVCGLHSVLYEIIEAQKLAQHERLSTRKMGRCIQTTLQNQNTAGGTQRGNGHKNRRDDHHSQHPKKHAPKLQPREKRAESQCFPQ